MREYPVFVPHEGDYLGATITVPDDEARGLVLLFTGTGAPRSHRFQMWARLARVLAGQGLASVRMDRLGIGDSTGRLEASVMGDVSLLAQALTVARFAQQAIGASRIGVIGNCSGSRIALSVAAEMRQSIGVICILPRVLEPSGVNRMAIRARRSKMASVVRASTSLRGVRRALGGRSGRLAPWVGTSLPVVLERAQVMFVYSPDDTDSYNEKVRVALKGLVGRLRGEMRDRFELRMVSGGGPLHGFDSLEIQETVLGLLAGWMPGCFGQAGSDQRLPSQAGSGVER